jgi:hypothetical protein
MAITLDQLKPKRSTKPPRIIFYAVPGFGKTTFASQAPSPIFLQCEDGTGELELSATPLLKDFDDLMEAIGFLAEEKHDFKTVVLDTADACEKIIHKEVVRRHSESTKPIQSIEDVGYGKGYTKAAEIWREVINALEYLREEKGMTPIILAHSQIKAFTPPDQDAFDRYRFNLHDKSADLLLGWADIVLFGNYKLHTKTSGEGFNKQTKGIGGDQRAIYTEERAAHWGKNRYGLPYEIPFEKGSQWAAFSHYLNKKEEQKNKSPKFVD